MAMVLDGRGRRRPLGSSGKDGPGGAFDEFSVNSHSVTWRLMPDRRGQRLRHAAHVEDMGKGLRPAAGETPAVGTSVHCVYQSQGWSQRLRETSVHCVPSGIRTKWSGRGDPGRRSSVCAKR